MTRVLSIVWRPGSRSDTQDERSFFLSQVQRRHSGDGAAAERYMRDEGLPSVGWLMVLLLRTFYGARTAASIVGRARSPRDSSMSAKTTRRPPVASAMTQEKNAPASTVAAASLAVS